MWKCQEAEAVKWLIPMTCLMLMGLVGRVHAHGVEIEYQSTQALDIQATYDTGEPMKNAQVSVYAPGKDTPWLTGTTNDQGRFTFAPDTSQPGNWEVKVRLAGHGGILAIPVAANQGGANQGGTAIAQKHTGYTPLQQGVMTLSVIWGLVGTALFFARRK